MRPTRILTTGVTLAVVALTQQACGTAEPSAPAPPPSAAEPTPSPPPSSSSAGQGAGADLDAILAGDRKTLIHLADADRDLSATYEGPISTGDGTDDGALFRLLPVVGGQYMIEALRPREEGGRWCAKVDTGQNPATLATVECAEDQSTVFKITETGKADDKGRPTHYVTSETYGALQWSAERKALYVEEVGDAPITGTFSFVDRGAA